MLNELIKANAALSLIGWTPDASHPYFKNCPASKKGSFIIYINEQGNVEDVDIPGFGMETVFRWQKDKMDPAFPVFNGRAFYEVTCEPSLIPTFINNIFKGKITNKNKTKRKKSAKSEDNQNNKINTLEIQSFVNGCNDLWEDDLKFIDRCLHELPCELQRKYLKTAPEKPVGYSAHEELIRRLELCQPDNLRSEVRKIILQKLLDTGKKEFADVLFAFKKNDKKKGRGKEHGRDFLFLLSIKDWDQSKYGETRFPPYPYQDSPLRKWMSHTFAEQNNMTYKSVGKKDAFGLDIVGSDEKYDDIDIKGLGQIKLFAAYEKIPCLARYGLKSTALFSAGHSARELARKTLMYLLAPERKGATWISLTKYENRNTVAFAYCTKLMTANVIKVFENDDTDDGENIYISEEATKSALKAFEGIAESEPAAEIIIGIIAAVDRGNSKILASRHYPLKYYMAGARNWQQGCVNIPDVTLPWLFKKEKILKGSLPIYPIRAIWLLNSAWRQDGEMIMRKQGKQKVPISKHFSSSDALDFLFDSNEIILERVEAGLENIIDKSAQALIMAKLKALLAHIGKGDKVDFKNNEYLHMIPTLYGLLLHKKGIRKENYMNENIFYLGRFFAVVDKLHIHYSLDVRNGDVPMRLIGNDHVSVAMQNPLEAFVSLSRRLEHPYISWAKRVKPDTIPKQAAKNCLKDIAEITSKLTETQIPTEISDADKAKLILGYLSYGAKEYESEEDINTTAGKNNKEE